MVKVTGNTYPAQSLLKKAGFEFDSGNKSWYGNEDALAEMERTSTPSYSRANAKAFAGLKIEKY